jgi:transposase-like protein
MGHPEIARTKRTKSDYTLAFKLAVVDRVRKGELTYKQAQTLYGIQGASTVLKWIRQHSALAWSSQAGAGMEPFETPVQKIKRLEQALKDLQELNYLKDEVLKEVDHQCGTDFRKKYLSSVPARLKVLAK